MHVVTSYDFGGSSEVRLHVVTNNLDLAQEVYASVLAVCEQENNAGGGCCCTKMLVELTHVPKDTRLLGADARTLFWGTTATGAQNNNNNQ